MNDPDPIDVAVGQRVRLLRRARGLTQSDLGSALGLTFQQVQKYERGSNRISASKLWKTAELLGVPVVELFGADEKSGESSAMLSYLGQPGAAELLEAWSRIESPDQKRAVMFLIRTMQA